MVQKLPHRTDRISVKDLRGLACRVQVAGLSHEAAIRNISTSGVGLFWSEEDRKASKSGSLDDQQNDQVIDAEILLQDAVYAVQLKVKHQTADVLGCQFEKPSRAFKNALKTYFEFELAAFRMVRIDPKLMKAHPEGTAVWFEGENNCNLYLVTDGERIELFNMMFLGNYVEGRHGATVRFGSWTVDSGQETSTYQSRNAVTWDQAWPAEMVTHGLRFLRSVPQLEANYRSQLESWLALIPTIKDPSGVAVV